MAAAAVGRQRTEQLDGFDAYRTAFDEAYGYFAFESRVMISCDCIERRAKTEKIRFLRTVEQFLRREYIT